MSKNDESNYDIYKYPGMTRENELYSEETARIIAERGGEEFVTLEDNEEIERRVRSRLDAEGVGVRVDD
jgi:hypothetical protein